MILRRLLVLLLLVLAPLPVAASPAYACSCKEGAALAKAEIAFVGVVSAIDAQSGDVRVAFDVESVIKGEATDGVTLTTSDSEVACGYHFDEGGRYRVFAVAGQTSLCSGNEIVTATPAYTARVERVSTDRTTIFWTGSVLLVVIVAGGVTALLRLSRQR